MSLSEPSSISLIFYITKLINLTYSYKIHVMVIRKEGKKLQQNIIPYDYVEEERRETFKKLKEFLTAEEMEEISK